MAQSALATFTYVSDTYQTWTVPSGVTMMRMVASGAQGAAPSSSSYAGGLGAEVTAILPVTPGHVLWIYVPSQPWIGGGPGFASSADGGGAAVVVDITTGELLVVAGGGGGSDGTAAGGNGGEVGSAGGGSVAGTGATATGAGGGGASGSGPATASTSGATVGSGGSQVSGGGAGFYGGGAGGTLTPTSEITSYTYSDNQWTAETTTDTPPLIQTMDATIYGSSFSLQTQAQLNEEISSTQWSWSLPEGLCYASFSPSAAPFSPNFVSLDTGGAGVNQYVAIGGSGVLDPSPSAGPNPAPCVVLEYEWSYLYTPRSGALATTNGEDWLPFLQFPTDQGPSYTASDGTVYYQYPSGSVNINVYLRTFTPVYSDVTTVEYGGSGGGGSSYAAPGAAAAYVSGAQTGSGSVVLYPAPLYPTVSLTTPGDGAYANLAGTPTFAADYINTDGSECAAWQFEWIEGATTTYWDAASAQFVSSAVWNPGSATVTFPAGTFVNGSTASWSMNLQSSYGTTYTSGFATPFQVSGQDPPVAAITYPVASSLSSLTELELSAVPASGLAITSWRLVVYPEAAVSASGFEWGADSPSLDTGTIAGIPPATYTPAGLLLGVGYIAGLIVTETYGEPSSWASSGPFELYTVLAVSGGVSATGDLGVFSQSVGWAPGYLTSGGGTVLPATVTSSLIRSFSDIDSLAFATQQSDPIQLIPDDTFTSPHLQTWPFPQVTDPAYAAINDFKTVGGVGASLMADRPGVLLVQGVDPVTAVSDQTISVLPTPVLAEGQLLTSQSTPSGLVSPSFVPSGAGELYLGVRFVPLTSLVAVLQLWNAVTSEVLVEWSLPAGASQAVQTWRPYAIGSLVPAGTPLQLALVVEGSVNRWMLQALSAFDEGVVWEFTVDGGVNWVEATQVRNQRYGSVMFPAPGRQMQWRATFYQPDRVVSHLRIRPHYVGLRHAGGPPVRSGPSVLASSPTADANTDPFFAGGRSPIPSSWFAPGTVRAGQMGP